MNVSERMTRKQAFPFGQGRFANGSRLAACDAAMNAAIYPPTLG
jgi:hypothetical protein